MRNIVAGLLLLVAAPIYAAPNVVVQGIQCPHGCNAVQLPSRYR